MTQKKSKALLFRILYALSNRNKKKYYKSKSKHFTIGKRQKFAFGVSLSSLILFLTAYNLNGYGIFTAFILALFSDLVLFWAIHDDLKNNFSPHVFILPFLYSLSFGLFSFLTPARLIIKLILTTL